MPVIILQKDEYTGDTGTIAFQVSSELFYKIKDYLHPWSGAESVREWGTEYRESDRGLRWAVRGTVSDDSAEGLEEAEEEYQELNEPEGIEMSMEM